MQIFRINCILALMLGACFSMSSVCFSAPLSEAKAAPSALPKNTIGTNLTGHDIDRLYKELQAKLAQGDYKNAWRDTKSYFDFLHLPPDFIMLIAQTAHLADEDDAAFEIIKIAQEFYPSHIGLSQFGLALAERLSDCRFILAQSELYDHPPTHVQTHNRQPDKQIALFAQLQARCLGHIGPAQRTLSISSYRDVLPFQNREPIHIDIHDGSYLGDLCTVYAHLCPPSRQISVANAAPVYSIIETRVEATKPLISHIDRSTDVQFAWGRKQTRHAGLAADNISIALHQHWRAHAQRLYRLSLSTQHHSSRQAGPGASKTSLSFDEWALRLRQINQSKINFSNSLGSDFWGPDFWGPDFWGWIVDATQSRYQGTSSKHHGLTAYTAWRGASWEMDIAVGQNRIFPAKSDIIGQHNQQFHTLTLKYDLEARYWPLENWFTPSHISIQRTQTKTYFSTKPPWLDHVPIGKSRILDVQIFFTPFLKKFYPSASWRYTKGQSYYQTHNLKSQFFAVKLSFSF